MKKFTLGFGVVALAAILAMGLTACGESSSTSTNTNTAKTYTIATDTTFSPFEFQDKNGNYTGIDIDLMNAIAADQGFKVNIQALGFDAALQAVQANQADGVIAGMSITDERKKIFDYSDPYYDSGVVMGVASNSSITSYADLKGKTVAVKKGTEGQTFAESIADQYGFTTTTFSDSSTMYQDVVAGNSAACFEDYPVLGYYISQKGDLKMVGDTQAKNQYGFAVKKGTNAELIQKFNAGLKDIKANGTYDQIIKKYVSTGASK